ncbi:hypothetical protein C2E23DRAFT_145702 [Lenzites betulinus]|nr:hypothetical protein C2E23DRAFT_145702 [Lenzites betulinus]
MSCYSITYGHPLLLALSLLILSHHYSPYFGTRTVPLPSFGAHTPHTSTTYQPYLYHLFSCRIIGYAARPPTPVCVARRVSAHHAVGTAQHLYGFMAHVPTVPSGTEGVPW